MTTTTLFQTCPAVDRSSELLSCARTALKIAQSNAPPNAPLFQYSPSDLCLHSSLTEQPSFTLMQVSLEDGLTLLRQMKKCLESLETLVKRRGHTNDPTMEISHQLEQWEEFAKELSQLQVGILPSSHRRQYSKQETRHYELTSAWLQAVAAQQACQVKEILKVRGQVLQDQAQRRKLLNPKQQSQQQPQHGGTRKRTHHMSPSSFTTTTAMNSPLFTVTNNINGTLPVTQSAPNTFEGQAMNHGNHHNNHGGYGGGGGYGGTTTYGGGGSFSMGMRHRKQQATTTTQQQQQQQQHSPDHNEYSSMIQQRQARRATFERLETARQAESKLAELSTLFGKMSTLIVQQGEVLEKVEDDVEAALDNVSAGEEEIQILYKLKKGNRSLILKVFGIVIFFIIFMRLY